MNTVTRVVLLLSLTAWCLLWTWQLAVSGTLKTKVKDANGKTVGTVVGFMVRSSVPTPIVLVPTEHGFAQLTLTSSGFAGGSGGIVFESVDCSGQPWISLPAEDVPTMLMTAVIGTRNTLYIADPEAGFETARFRSGFTFPRLTEFADVCDENFDFIVAGGSPALRAIRVMDLLDVYTPPFRLLVKEK